MLDNYYAVSYCRQRYHRFSVNGHLRGSLSMLISVVAIQDVAQTLVLCILLVSASCYDKRIYVHLKPWNGLTADV